MGKEANWGKIEKKQGKKHSMSMTKKPESVISQTKFHHM